VFTITLDYTPAIRQSAGIGRIVRGQVDALIQANPGYDLRLFVVGKVTDDERANAPLPLHTTPISERNMVRIWHRLNSPIPQIEWFMRESNKADGSARRTTDLLHATDFVLPPSRARKKMLTVHDLAFIHHPETAMPSLHHYLNVVVPRSIHKADHILADSQHTANDIVETWAIDAEQITVAQGAVDHNRFCPTAKMNDDTITSEQTARAWLGIGNRPFILGLSTLQPRKNFVRLIEAFHQARQEADLPHCLIIGGGKGWMYDKIYERINTLDLADHVLLPGFVPDELLPALYRAAEFFAYPSLYEGFGIPIIEALACGTPVLTATNSCLPEAGGRGAIYVDAQDVESIANGILQLAQDQSLQRRLRQAGLEHAAQFTWERSAQQVLEAYQKVLS